MLQSVKLNYQVTAFWKLYMAPSADAASMARPQLGIYGFLFALYVGTGPVYWLPGIDHYYIDAVKLLAYLACVGYPLAMSFFGPAFRFPGGNRILGLLLLFIVFSIPGLIFSSFQAALYRTQNSIQILLFVYAVGFLIYTNRVFDVLKLAITVFIFVVVACLLYMTFAPYIISPLNEGLTIADTGFGGSRTSWSPAIALYLPWIYVFGSYSVVGATILIACFLASQFFTAGRTGMVSSLVPFLIWGLFRKSFKALFTMIVGVGVLVAYITSNLEKLRWLNGGFRSFAELNDLSTGRVEQYVVALRLIAENPLFGTGFGEAVYDGRSWYIHNAVLRFSAEGGLFLGLIIIFIFSIAVYRGVRHYESCSPVYLGALLTVIAGIVASMFEPGFMFGSFNNSVFWWFCFSICVTRRTLHY